MRQRESQLHQTRHIFTYQMVSADSVVTVMFTATLQSTSFVQSWNIWPTIGWTAMKFEMSMMLRGWIPLLWWSPFHLPAAKWKAPAQVFTHPVKSTPCIGRKLQRFPDDATRHFSMNCNSFSITKIKTFMLSSNSIYDQILAKWMACLSASVVLVFFATLLL